MPPERTGTTPASQPAMTTPKPRPLGPWHALCARHSEQRDALIERALRANRFAVTPTASALRMKPAPLLGLLARRPKLEALRIQLGPGAAHRGVEIAPKAVDTTWPELAAKHLAEEAELVEQALLMHGCRHNPTAQALGVTLNTLKRILGRHPRLSPPRVERSRRRR